MECSAIKIWFCLSSLFFFFFKFEIQFNQIIECELLFISRSCDSESNELLNVIYGPHLDVT